MSKAFKERLKAAEQMGSKVLSKFGASIMAKYGWKEGEGLGKNQDGIVDPVKLNNVEGNRGLGKKEFDPWHNWWDDLYNKTASKSACIKAVGNTESKESPSADSSDSLHEDSGESSEENNRIVTTKRKHVTKGSKKSCDGRAQVDGSRNKSDETSGSTDSEDEDDSESSTEDFHVISQPASNKKGGKLTLGAKAAAAEKGSCSEPGEKGRGDCGEIDPRKKRRKSK